MHALEDLAAARRWRVLPCHHITSGGRCSCGRRDCPSPGKHPRLRHGLSEASNDPETVAAWARHWRSANVGVATGPASNLLVVDLDGPGAKAWWAEAQLEHGRTPRPPYLAQTTPGHGGGLHIFFAWPTDGRTYRNSAGRIAPGVDVRGDGGYVIVAPSNHLEGVYAWVDESAPVVEMPEWLADLCAEPPAPEPRPSTPAPASRGQGYGAAALAKELATLAATPEGGRNHALNTAAYNLGQLVAGGELDVETVRAALAGTGRAIGLAEREIDKTIDSGLDGGARSPRSAPDPPARSPTLPPGAGGGDYSDNGHQRRTIVVNDRPLGGVTDDVEAAIDETNDPPLVFQRGGALVRLRVDEQGRVSIEALTSTSLRHYADRAAVYNALRWTADGERRREVFPPKDAVADLLERPGWPYPPLRAVSAAPIVRPDGTIHARHGYDPTTGYYHWSPGDLVPPIPADPSVAERENAASIIDEALCDFPFETDADLANAWGLLLTPLVRALLGAVPPMALIDSPQPGTGKGLLVKLMSVIAFGSTQPMTPLPDREEEFAKLLTTLLLQGMALIDSPQPGTGKGLLVKLMSVIAFGSTQPMTPLPDREEEFAKLLTTLLLQGQPLIVIDNVDRPLRSPTLAACLTSDPYAGRVLGQSSAPPVPNAAVYVATGNNIALGGDLARRCYRIRLNFRGPNPDQRQGFTHDPLLGWAAKFRHELLAALAIHARAWWVAGQPAADVPAMGEATEWARIVGGIVTHAGVPGFLGNLADLRHGGDLDDDEWAAFLAAARAAFGPAQFTAADLTKRLEAEPPFRSTLPGRLAGAWETKSWPTTLGSNLRSRQGRFHGEAGFYIRRHHTDRLGRAIWSIGQHDDPDDPDAITPPSSDPGDDL